MTQDTPPKAEAPSVGYRLKVGFKEDPKTLDVKAAEGDIRPWDLDTKFKVVSGRYPRLDGPQKVTGRAKYTFDVNLPGMLWAKMVRASVPAGEIVNIDTSKAEKLPGVRAVWTTDSRYVRFAGQDVAAVAAVSPELAEDAARLVKVTYDERPYVTDLRKAMEAGAALVYDANQFPESAGDDEKKVPRNGNIVGPNVPRRGGSRGDVEKGFAEAEVSIEATYYIPVHTHQPLESHGVVAKWDGDQLTVYASTQAVFGARDGIADALKVDRKNVEVICEHMGGGFGSKLGPSATGSAFSFIACKLARQAGAPVKLMLDRKEEHVCTGNAPSALMTYRIGAQRDGTMTALHARSYGSAGIASGAGTSGPATAIYTNCPNLKVENFDVFTNAGPDAPLRAPGHPQGAFGLESAVDELAAKLGMDPVELRKKNDPNPVRLKQYEVGAKAIGWERRNKVPGGGTGPKKRGIGVAGGNWYVIAPDQGFSAECRIHRDGSVEALHGAQDIGTGFRTAMAIIVAEELGLKPTDIKMSIGDSRLPPGPTSGGSLTTNTAGPTVRLAAHDARQKVFAVAAPLLGARPEDLDAADGRIFLAKSPSRSVPFKQAVAKMAAETIVGRGERKKQFETYRGDLAGAQFCEVEVDVETGIVRVLKMVGAHDCGIPINALTAESQVIGGMIQGVSWALLEESILDRNMGTIVNPNLEWYKILSPMDMFEAVPILTSLANAGNNTSAAGIGEPPIVPTLAAVANAIYNATGARCRTLPFTPDRVLAALAEARRA
jgi:xanthine dehydrogenase YagR molybdenum-binding subunit